MKSAERRFDSVLANIDWTLIVCAAVLSVAGIVMIYSATMRTGSPVTFVGRQFFAMLIGMLLCALMIWMNYKMLADFAPHFYVLGTLMLVAVLLFGTQIRGTRGWFNLGFFNFQPVEVTKLFFITILAAYLSANWKNIFRLGSLVVPAAALAVQVVLILAQPDFSSAIVYFPIFIFMIYFAGAGVIHIAHIVLFGAISVGIPLAATYIKIKHPDVIKSLVGGFLYRASYDINTALAALLAAASAIFFMWWIIHKLRFRVPLIFAISLVTVLAAGTFSSFVVSRSLKEYQRRRLIVFVDPKIDPLGSGYNIIQSQIAVGSGRIFGKGVFAGSQSGLGFLPEQHTDFVFSVIGEETGFLGSAAFLGVYFLFMWRVLAVIRDARDRTGSLMAAGIGVMFIFYFVTNIAMTLGLAPVTGLPLPFVSYGGSSMASAWMAVGILESIHARRFTY
ncbi:MAG: rod shape-determining protein RodA [Elusimicrobia bacterium HGW-Elusimicrobia-1]|jgi:rod shape determining protein RodA|nr:MAG: rod shape-determining protein RodA [Elusimicrobia bacterium HGW-Elusimicrobia-1]